MLNKKINDSNIMFFIQINLHKAKLAAIELHRLLQKSVGIALITEPYLFKGRIVGLPQGYDSILITEEGKLTRAALLIPKAYKAICLSSISTPDCVAAQIIVKGDKYVLVSTYMDINGTLPPLGTQKAIDYADKYGCKLIIGTDSNAHSTLYGPDTNQRGELMEEFILENGLMVENVGVTPTFATWRADRWMESCIDVTLSKGCLLYTSPSPRDS